MSSGERQEVELICDNSVIDSIIDKFGKDVTILAHDMTSFRVIANIAIGKAFYSWVFGFSGMVKIKAPEQVKNEYISIVKFIANQLM